MWQSLPLHPKRELRPVKKKLRSLLALCFASLPSCDGVTYLDVQNMPWCTPKGQTSEDSVATPLSILALTRLCDELRLVDYSCPNKVITLRLIEIEDALHLQGLDLLSWQS